MNTISPTAYDRAITVFSPEGRLFQVEYAKEAIKKGATAIGAEYKSGVIIGIDKQVSSDLEKKESIEKIHRIGEHVGAATSGLVADGRKLIDYARVAAQQEKMTYNQKIDITKLTKEVCDLKQKYTQYGGTRPFGVSLIIAGVDEESGKHLYTTYPSGAFMEYKAAVIGSGEEDLRPYLEREYDEGMNRDQAIKFVLDALKEAKGDEFNEKTAEIAYITEKDKQFEKLTEEDVAKHVKEMEGKSK